MALAVLLMPSLSNAQLVLLGDNTPHHHANIMDGDFEAVSGNWREAKQSHFWTTKNGPGDGDFKMGIHEGAMFSNNDIGIAESKVLRNAHYHRPRVGDVLNWDFGADLEYASNGSISLSLVFGKHERIVAEKVKLKGGDNIIEHFEGAYTLTAEDAAEGLPFVRATFYSEDEIKVFLHYVNVTKFDPRRVGPKLTVEKTNDAFYLEWADPAPKGTWFTVYRQLGEGQPYKTISVTTGRKFVDKKMITGVDITYVVVRKNPVVSGPSNKVVHSRPDKIPPTPPKNISAVALDAEIKVSWENSTEEDFITYSVFRDAANGNKMEEIASGLKKTSFIDFSPKKGKEHTYLVYAFDKSGNKSKASLTKKAKVKLVSGASFSDLILPMPIHNKLSSDLWGADGVLPRDPDNGIEDPQWSYWGGKPLKGKDEKYHMAVVRWPSNGVKGHWEWPKSTVAHVVADKPTGPYKVKDESVYNFKQGLGHNADVMVLNDGTYLLYSLINWEASLFTSENMDGPWKYLGVMKVDEHTHFDKRENFYRFYRNLSGLQLEDGKFLFVTKAGSMMISQSDNPLGPYKVMSAPMKGNHIIPKEYRNSNYEDPVIWKDEVQYHMLINAFWDRRAIYLRSPNGIRWKFNPGTAYSPSNTSYEDGTQTNWYKLERPHVLQDEYGRATHLSLAAIDVPKAEDRANDNHNSKNIIMPLNVYKRLEMLNKKPVNATTESIKILIKSEPGFDAQNDIDISSLRFGASEVVDFGRGSKVIEAKNKKDDLIVEFNGAGNGITKSNFACKLLGKTKSGEILVGYTKMVLEK